MDTIQYIKINKNYLNFYFRMKEKEEIRKKTV